MEVEGDDLTVPGVELGRVIGRGASSVVYLGTQTRFGRPVGVKILHLPGQSELVARLFLNECRTLGHLTPHPNVVSVFDGGFVDPQRPYLVMEYLPGGSLAEQLAEDGPLPVEEVLKVGVQLAGGLHSAHLHGIIHGDIKPQNVLRARTGEVALADFGVARLTSVAGATTRAPLLTPLHAAPELFEGAALTPRSDVYELCSTLFELLDGDAPLGTATESPLLVLGRMAKGAQRPLDRTAVPDAVADVVESGLTTDPLARPASALELGEALRSAQRSLGLEPTALVVIEPLVDESPVPSSAAAAGDAAPPTSPDVNAGATLPPAGLSPDALVEPGAPRRRAPLVLAVVAVLTVVAVAALLAVRGSSDGSETPRADAPADTAGEHDGSTSTMPPEVKGAPYAGLQPGTDYDLPDFRDQSSVLAARIGDTQALMSKFDPTATALAQPTFMVERLPARVRWQSFNPSENPRCPSMVTWPLTLVGLWEKASTWDQHQAAVRVLQFATERDAAEAFAAFSLEQGIRGDGCSGIHDYPKAYDHSKIEVHHRAVDLGLGSDARWNSFVAPPPAGMSDLSSVTTAIAQRGAVVVLAYVASGAELADPSTLGAVIGEVLDRADK